MTEHQRHTEFLRDCIRYDDTGERHKLEDRITHLLHSERCVRRAVWLMIMLIAVAMGGLSYSAIFHADYPQNIPRFMTLLLTRGLCALGLGSLLCLLCFLSLGVSYRRRLDEAREDCRRLALRMMESRLGQPTRPLTASKPAETGI